MIQYEDDCVGCPPEMGCMGSACPYQNTKHLYCDCCGDETDVLYEFNEEQLCEYCVLDKLHKIT